MPTEMSSWADEIDETDTSLILPPPSEKWVGNQKITTEYSHNDEGKKVGNFLRSINLALNFILYVTF